MFKFSIDEISKYVDNKHSECLHNLHDFRPIVYSDISIYSDISMAINVCNSRRKLKQILSSKIKYYKGLVQHPSVFMTNSLINNLHLEIEIYKDVLYLVCEEK